MSEWQIESSDEDLDAVERADTEAAAYEVGKGRPPVGRRFAKGQSGNPRGRPKVRGGSGAPGGGGGVSLCVGGPKGGGRPFRLHPL